MESFVDSLLAAAQVHSLAGRRSEALRLLQQVLVHNAAHGEALEIACYLSRDEGNFTQAADYMDAALGVLPATRARLREASIINRKALRLKRAAALFEQFAALVAPDAEILLTVGLAWAAAGESASALIALQKAVRLFPTLWQMHYNLGIVFGQTREYEREIACYDLALRLKPDAFDAHLNKAIALHALHRFDACLASFKKAIQLDGRHAGARRKRAQTNMLLGDFAQGLRDYEYRWEEVGATRPFGDHIWNGKADLRDKTILLYNEQGLGDTLHYVRFTENLTQRGARIILRVQAALASLFHMQPLTNTGAYTAVDGIFAEGEALPPFDFHIPMMSLPLALNMTRDTIPASIPYVKADPTQVAAWQQKLSKRDTTFATPAVKSPHNPKPRIGIVWSGNPANKNDKPRSTQLMQWRALFDLPAQFVSLQKEVRDGDVALLAELDEAGTLWDCASALQSYADTAALVSALDLVISVDTSVAHLSGALGRNTWVLLPFTPDPRWFLERDDSPWYPTATLFRQPREADWQSVFAEVRQALAASCKVTPF